MKGPVHGVATAVAKTPEKNELPMPSPLTFPAKPTAEPPTSKTPARLKPNRNITNKSAPTK